MIVGVCGKKVETIDQLIPLIEASSLTPRLLEVETTRIEEAHGTDLKQGEDLEGYIDRALLGELDEETHNHASRDDEISWMMKSPEDNETGNENEIQTEKIETHKQVVETIQRRIIKVSLPDGRLGIVLKDGPGCSNRVIVKRILDESPLMGAYSTR